MRLRLSCAVVIGLGVGTLAACAPKPLPPAEPATDLAPAPAPAKPSELGTGVRSERSGAVPRASVIAVLDRGPALFLRAHDVVPVAEQGRLVGWRLMRFFPTREASPLSDLDLNPGDVLLRVNGAVVERPEQLMAIWESLYTAGEIRAELARDRELIELRYQIVDPEAAIIATPASSTPAAAAPPPAKSLR